RQRRRRAPGARRRARGRGVAAHGRAGCGALPPGPGGTGAGHGALRDAAGPPAPDRLRRAARRDRRPVGAGHSFVPPLGHSRRRYVRAFRHERQSCWFEGIEGAFAHFGGVPEEVLLDNPRALVVHHDAATREVRFHERLLAFASYWGFRPRACAPYRARTKGKDERSVGFVKRNAIAGRSFPSWEAFEAPLVRFQRAEAQALRPLDGKPPFEQTRELVRQVGSDCCVELDTNAYSVPWRLIGEAVRVQAVRGQLRILHAGHEVAAHAECRGLRHQRVIDPAHFEGVAGFRAPVRRESIASEPSAPALLRPLVEYEQLTGGSW